MSRVKLALRGAWQILVIPFPWSVRRFLLGAFLGFKLHPKSRIGAALILAENVVLEEGARIASLTIVSPLQLLHLHRHAAIGRGNRIVGQAGASYFSSSPNRKSALIMHEHSGITRKHLLDCSDTIEIGKFSLVAGWRSQILTHSPDFEKNRQMCLPTVIGSYYFIGSASVILKGAQVPDFCIIGAGSVVSSTTGFESHTLIAGTPARAVKRLSPTLRYFQRTVGIIP